jgi:alpha-D-ribose 1-methylphosphonate 5-triphosphate diphosphatase PhnM
MTPNIDEVVAAFQRRTVASTLSDLSDELDYLLPAELDLAIDAFEAAFRPSTATTARRRSSMFRSTASLDHGLTARCPALDDLVGAVDASGEEECQLAGVFARRERYFHGESKGHRQFPTASLNTQN